MHPSEPVDGFTNEVRLYELDPESASQVRDVLNAGATIGAVRETDTHGHYLVRSELHTFLSDVDQAGAQAQARGDRAGARPRPAREAHPRSADAATCWRPRMRSCSTCIRSTRCAASRRRSFSTRSTQQHLRPVRNLLTAGSSLRVVARDKSNSARYLRARRSLHDARPHQGARAGDGVAGPPAHRGWPAAGMPPSPTAAPSACSPTAAADARPPTARRTTSCARSFQETLMESLGLSLAALRKIAGAGDRRIRR